MVSGPDQYLTILLTERLTGRVSLPPAAAAGGVRRQAQLLEATPVGEDLRVLPRDHLK
jgi:hypothetical protein